MRKLGYIFIIVLIAFFLYAPFDSEFSKEDKPDLDITFGEIDPGDIINGCRLRLGTPPRENIAGQQIKFIMARPEWTKESNAETFARLYEIQSKVLINGKIVWGSIVQAHEDLFKGTGEQLPASIVYSFDESIDSQPKKLDNISEKIFNVKSNNADPELKAFAEMLADENTISLKVKVPASISDGLDCYLGFVMIEPDYLPKNKLSKRLLPIIAMPDEYDTALLLPSKFWDSRLAEFFKK